LDFITYSTLLRSAFIKISTHAPQKALHWLSHVWHLTFGHQLFTNCSHSDGP